MYQIQQVKYSEVRDYLMNMFNKHWMEIGQVYSGDAPLNIDEELYLTLESMNKHVGFIVKDEEEIIGYLSLFIHNNHHNKDVVAAATDCFFIDPSKRGYRTFKAVRDMFKMAEGILRDNYGVHNIYLSSSHKKSLHLLANYLEYKECDVVYVKNLR